MQSVATDGTSLLFGTGPDYDVQFGIRMAVLMALNPPAHTVSGVNPFLTEYEAEAGRARLRRARRETEPSPDGLAEKGER